MFADDLTLMYSAETLDDKCIASDTFCLQKWIACNQLYLNETKSELTRFCELLTDIGLQQERLKSSHSVKYLGIHLDKNLSTDGHVDKVVKCIPKYVFSVTRIKKIANRNDLILYCRSFIEPIVRYGLCMYGCIICSNYHRSYMVQRKMLLIFSKKQRESVYCLFSDFTILSVYDLYIQGVLKFFLKSVNAKVSEQLLSVRR